MNICKIFIDRPVTTIILTLALVIFGFFAYLALPISALPNVDFPTIVVTANLPGADPETMATSVATPIEKQLSTIAGLNSMNSMSYAGETQITLQFSLDRNIDAAAQDVQSALLAVTRHLPSGMPDPPTIKKVNPADAPVLYLALTANNLPLTTVDNYAENFIAPRLSMIEGVAQVNVYGAQQYAVRINLNPSALTNRGLSIDSVANAIQNLSVNQPTGILQSSGYYRLIKVDAQLSTAKQFGNAIIATQNGAPVRLKDLGIVRNSVANDQAATWYNNKRAIVLAVQRQPGANTVSMVKSILQVLPTLTTDLPGGANLQVVYNNAQFIEDSIKDVQFTLLFAALLVVGIIFLFLNNISSTFIAVLSLPVSIIATFGFMYLFGFNLDNLSLMGLVLAVGFVIDDAVVVLENIMRHVESGMDRLSASLVGSKEIGFTVVAMTLSLVAVFIPVFFMGGIIGRLFYEFAAVVAIAILISGIVSLTLVPMLCSRLISYKSLVREHKQSSFERIFNDCKVFYEQSLRWSLNHGRFVLVIALILFIITIVFFDIVPKGFIPSQDIGLVFGTVEAPEGITFKDFVKEQQMVAAIIAKNPAVDGVISSVGQGAGGVNSNNTGTLVLRLKPLGQRKLSSDEVVQQVQQQVQKIPGLNVFLISPPAIRTGSKSSNSNYQFVLQSTNWQVLQNSAKKLQTALASIKGVQNIDSDLELSNPELKLHVLRDRAAALGITPADIELALYSAYGQRQVASIMTGSGDYDVVLAIDPKYQHSVKDIDAISLRSSSGLLVPLSAVVTEKEGVGPLVINHYGQLPAITLSFNLSPGYSLGKITNQVTTLAKNTLPANVTGSFAGDAQTFQQSMTSLPLLLLSTILVIYMVLAILYEHFIHPITILTALPFAAFGALLALLVFNQELDIFSFIGLIMLVGLTKKNGIIMIDFAIEARREKNLSAKEAIAEACSIRFRPIMMTTMSAIVASLPIALGLGAGGDTRQALGIAVVGGLVFSQLITLYVTPVFYLAMDRLSSKLAKSK
ncbi:MAG: acriflavine resistance protein B [Gammaproteobacteria bacterium RIFCSPHIGHO2_12_FULL_35_23]|nr:MAG: acriflavine resistance protein B [Gammaproteobacteria bacterium RIFCSPHIGHO2_12_FULL_35_23]